MSVILNFGFVVSSSVLLKYYYFLTLYRLLRRICKRFKIYDIFTETRSLYHKLATPIAENQGLIKNMSVRQ